MIFLFKAIFGLLLFEAITTYDGEDLLAEQSQDSFSSSGNSIVLQQGQPFTLASNSFSSNVNGRQSGGTQVYQQGRSPFVNRALVGSSVGGNSYGVVSDYDIYNSAGDIRSNVPDTTRYWWVGNANSPFKAVVDQGALTCVSANECYDSTGRLVANKVFDSATNNNNNYNNYDSYKSNGNNVVVKRDYSQNLFLNGEYAAATNNNNNVVRRQSVAPQNYGASIITNSQYPSDSSAFASNPVLSVGSVIGSQSQSYYVADQLNGGASAYVQNGNSQFPSQSVGAGLGSGFVKASSFVDEPKQYLPPVPTPQPCNGRNQACVPSQQCQNGYISQSQYAALGLSSNNQNCNPNFEVCCSIEAPQTQRPIAPSTYRPVTQPPTNPPTQRPTNPPTQRPTYQRPNDATTQPSYLPPVNTRPQPTYRPVTSQTPRPQRPTPPPATPCPINGNACVSPQLCRNGAITSSAVPQGGSSTGQCSAPNVCCRVQAENNNQYLPPIVDAPSNENPNYLARPTTTTEKPENDYIGGPSDDNQIVVRPSQPPRRPSTQPPRVFDDEASNNLNQFIPVGCPAALNCTQVEFCTAQGVISKTVVVLTPLQEQFRVPMTDCRDLEKGFTGKCCRDPDYTDPWPVGQLGQYNEEAFGFKPERRQNNPGRPGSGENELSRSSPKATTNQVNRVPSPQQPSASSVSAQVSKGPNRFVTSTFNQFTNDVTKPLSPVRPTSNIPTSTFGGFDQVPGPSGVCGIRNYDNVPRGSGPFDTAFGEFPWQAMVLLESNKSLLCGGAITDKNMVVTAAHCVSGLRPTDVLIKAGEWRLGSDEEPKKFQLIRVKSIMLHPAYQPTNLNYDVALLTLESNLNYDNHIAPICIDDAELDTSASTTCVTTGWGKNVLKIHISNALMHQSPVTIIPQDECQTQLSGYGFNPESSRCGRTQTDACDLDEGSALACEDGSGKYYIKGVYSSETECASPSQIVTFTKVDFSWVKQIGSSTGYTSPPQSKTPSKLYQTAESQSTGPQYLPPV